MIDLLGFLFAMLQLAFAYGFYRLYLVYLDHAARLTRLENQKPVKQEAKAAPVQAKQIWDKEIEGFNPKKPATVLPRSEEEKKARIYTNWEIDSDFKIIG
jgi:hypothetical protein